MAELTGKVAVVTGASRGIGAAIAKRFAKDGAKVVVNYAKSPGEAEKVVKAITDAGGQAIAVKADMNRPEEIKTLFAETKKLFGQLDILVNNAGVMKRGMLDEITPEDIDLHFDINVRGMILCVVEAAKLLPKGGVIVNVSSVISRMAYPGALVYTATKGAIDVMSAVMAQELGPKGIRVNVLSPGSTYTDMNSEKSGKTQAEFAMEKEKTALGRIGEVEDIADAAAFLVSHDARWVTGEILGAGGGIRG